MTKNRVSIKLWLISASLGCAIEGFFLAIINTYKPDPPLDPLDIVLLISQLPGAIIGGFIASAAGIRMTTEATSIFLFIPQAAFFGFLVHFVLKKWNLKCRQSPDGPNIPTPE